MARETEEHVFQRHRDGFQFQQTPLFRDHKPGDLIAQVASQRALDEVGAAALAQGSGAGPDALTMGLTVFVLAVFVGYYVVWSVTPALHTPLMSVTVMFATGSPRLTSKSRQDSAAAPAPEARPRIVWE